jgi:hypothetical protein
MRMGHKEATCEVAEETVIETVISTARDFLSVLFQNICSKMQYKTFEYK